MIREVKRIRLDIEKLGYNGVEMRGHEGEKGERKITHNTTH